MKQIHSDYSHLPRELPVFKPEVNERLDKGGKVDNADKVSSTNDWKISKDDKQTSVELDNGYSLGFNEKHSEVFINKPGGEKTRIWGDPHVDVGADGSNDFDFYGTTSFQLKDGTKITINTEPWAGTPDGWLANNVVVTKGEKSLIVDGLSQNKLGDFRIEKGMNGRELDRKIWDGKLTVHENPSGRGWVDETGGRVDQGDGNRTKVQSGDPKQLDFFDQYKLISGRSEKGAEAKPRGDRDNCVSDRKEKKAESKSCGDRDDRVNDRKEKEPEPMPGGDRDDRVNDRKEKEPEPMPGGNRDNRVSDRKEKEPETQAGDDRDDRVSERELNSFSSDRRAKGGANPQKHCFTWLEALAAAFGTALNKQVEKMSYIYDNLRASYAIGEGAKITQEQYEAYRAAMKGMGSEVKPWEEVQQGGTYTASKQDSEQAAKAQVYWQQLLTGASQQFQLSAQAGATVQNAVSAGMQVISRDR